MGCDFINRLNRASSAVAKSQGHCETMEFSLRTEIVKHQIHITQESLPRVKVPICKRRCKIHVQLKAWCME
ncbi:Fructose-bisphosphate aldolase [Psidium guajava]|nr:Fructose-bisphosphate aldolase [Psidium guajava]